MKLLKQILEHTDLKLISRMPTTGHPDQDYLFYASNKYGVGMFEVSIGKEIIFITEINEDCREGYTTVSKKVLK